ncbi:unnamed protein product [Nippostrongylus brasiliensis]|uniref:Peptidase M12A domain-containing protein n=1 Tax=Nippostrongylus brasiliensis TaxID=27835 RepID=A0A0N4YK44_NIPBR|nr:unnamed protein product [Nippostrongylus brasiliensis]
MWILPTVIGVGLLTQLAIGMEAPPTKNCRPKARAAPNLEGNSIDVVNSNGKRTVRKKRKKKGKFSRKPVQKVYFWPSLNDAEKAILRDAFFQIGRRTCVKFLEQEYKPWFHADRWESGQPYVLIRKSKKYAAYSDNSLEGLVDRTILYISESAFQMNSFNHSRGAVMDQLVRFMGMKKEMYRPDAASYIQPFAPVPLVRQPVYQPAQLMWPFDPESITIPLWARDKYRLTQYCPARNDVDIGAGQRLNSMYCPELVHADPQRGPCVVPRPKDADEFKRRVWAYKRLLSRNKRVRRI